MPRDLYAEKAKGAPLHPQLTHSPEQVDDMEQQPTIGPALASPVSESGTDGFFSTIAQKSQRAQEVYPYTQTLTVADVDSCVRVENAAFPANERATREKFQYRLRTCGELSMGIFTSQEESSDSAPPTTVTSSPVYSGAPSRKAALLGHVIATMGRHEVVTDLDMRIPDAATTSGIKNSEGHQEDGRTICIHSFAMLPSFKGRGLGRILLKAYLQRMRTQAVADRAALIARPDLVALYEKFGFEKVGESKVEFGGGGWIDMVLDLKTVDEDE